MLDINSAICITESDKNAYINGNVFNKAELEIPVSYRSIAHNGLEQINEGSRPYIIPNKAYDADKGILAEYTKPQYFNTFEIL